MAYFPVSILIVHSFWPVRYRLFYLTLFRFFIFMNFIYGPSFLRGAIFISVTQAGSDFHNVQK